MGAPPRTTWHGYEVAGWGAGELWVQGGVLVVHELPSSPRPSPASGTAANERSFLPTGGTRAPGVTVAAKERRERDDLVPDLCRRFTAHLSGDAVVYDDVSLDLDGMTELQLALTHALRAVPWGEVVSYGELAALAGLPRAARAAGAFCAENRTSLVVPCHRVVAASGIGGYGSTGVATKRRLLALEGVSL